MLLLAMLETRGAKGGGPAGSAYCSRGRESLSRGLSPELTVTATGPEAEQAGVMQLRVSSSAAELPELPPLELAALPRELPFSSCSWLQGLPQMLTAGSAPPGPLRCAPTRLMLSPPARSQL